MTMMARNRMRMPTTALIGRFFFVVVFFGMILCQSAVIAFTTTQPVSVRAVVTQQSRVATRSPQSSTTTSKLFSSPPSDDNDDKNNDQDQDQRVPFFARLKQAMTRKNGNNESNENNDVVAVMESSSTTATTTTLPRPAAPSAVTVEKKKEEEEETPAMTAARLQYQAEKLRLEAQRMDAELMLLKIQRLEEKIVVAEKKKGNNSNNNMEELMKEMADLAAKLRGDAPKAVTVAKRESTATTTKASSSTSTSSSGSKPAASSPWSSSSTPSQQTAQAPYSQAEIDTLRQSFKRVPPFIVKTLATTVGMEYETLEDIDQNELAMRMEQLMRYDFSFFNATKPTFSQSQIEQRVQEIKDGKWVRNPNMASDTRDMAIQTLEYEYYVGASAVQKDDFLKIAQGEEWMQPVLEAMNKSISDQYIEDFFPMCTRKTGTAPTEAQVQMLATDILPKAGFSCSSRPEAAPGGFIIRGTNKLADGDKLIDAIDAALAKSSSLKDKMTIVYIPDLTVLFGVEEEDLDDLIMSNDFPNALFVLGPDIVREQKRVALSIVSALGLATSWYLSIYPFLLNSVLAKRVEEDLALVDAGMVPDLAWLTDLSIPLFATFMGLQVAHELGHSVVAGLNGIKMTFPTFVPSLITGISSTVTTFKSPPKNKNVMFDISIAGPLTGLIASVIALYVGASLTLSSDPALLPALPLQILRQSTLGGGVIEAVLGADLLSIPRGAENTAQVAGIMIPLHPVAVAGFISLIVNALALIPVGTTDGGRVAVTLLGRSAKQVVANFFLAALCLAGFAGSDLFLFYFGFVLAFQKGNEIPSRNEVDALTFDRVLLATAGGVLVLLTLIPFQ